jgi:putative ABC transport system permease protein
MRRGAYVTPGFLSLLGIRPVLGRDFHPDETGSGLGIGLVSHGLWQSRYGGDPGVLDSTIVVDGSPVTIIGVLPPGFHFAPIGDADVWLPVDPGPRRDFRFNHWLRVIGRVRAEVPLGRVQEALAVTAGRIAARFPDTHEGRSALVVPLRQELLGGVQPVLVALFVAMGVVLLIACANIAGLLLARSLGREQEIQVRAALGATRWRLARQFLAESLIFTTIGTALGLLLGQLGLHRVLAALPAGVLDHLPALATSRMDWTVFGYTALIATLTGLAFGLGPMLHAFATDHSVVSSGHRSTGRRGLNRLRDVLIVGEIALTVVLLAGTALVGRSLLALLKVELGFRAEQVQTARVALAGPRYADDAANQQFFERLVQAMQELPEVTSVGAVSRLPLNGGGTGTMHLEGTPEPPVPERPEATIRIVAGDYFETLAIPLLAGRVFTARDDSSAPPAILVSRGLARRLDPSGDLVGRRIRLYFNPTVAWEIIGVVGDVRTGSLESEPPATIYMSHLQTSDNRFALVARTAMDEAAFARRVRERVASLDPRVPVYAMGTLNDVVNQDPAVATRRVPFILLSIFAGSALILAVAGLYGLVSYSVARRTRELGIRLALGAAPGQILLSVLGYGAGLALLGTAIGVGLAIWLSGLVTRLLFGVGALDPVAYGGSAALLILVTILATWIPARRATRVEPTSALRSM